LGGPGGDALNNAKTKLNNARLEADEQVWAAEKGCLLIEFGFPRKRPATADQPAPAISSHRTTTHQPPRLALQRELRGAALTRRTAKGRGAAGAPRHDHLGPWLQFKPWRG